MLSATQFYADTINELPNDHANHYYDFLHNIEAAYGDAPDIAIQNTLRQIALNAVLVRQALQHADRDGLDTTARRHQQELIRDLNALGLITTE